VARWLFVDAATVDKDVQDDPYHLVMALKCVHDMNERPHFRPFVRCACYRRALLEEVIIVMDERVLAETFQQKHFL
jgi:hypothetical protein